MSVKFCFLSVVCLLLTSIVCAESANNGLENYEGMTLFQKIRAFARDHPKEADEVLVRMAHMIPDEKEAEFHIKAIREALVDPFDEAGCQSCEFIVRLARILVFGRDYEVIKQTVYEWCVFLGFAIDQTMRAWEVCKTTDIQGPHVAEVLRNWIVNPRNEICEFQNACYQEVNFTALAQRRSTQNRRDAQPVAVFQPPTHRHRRPKPKNIPNQYAPFAERPRVAQIKIAQITDVHIEPKYLEGSLADCGLIVCCQSKYTDPGPTAGHFGDYNCNIPQRTLELFLTDLNTETPDVIIFSGDAPPHAIWEETLESQVACTEAVTDALSRLNPGIPAFTTTGNHEMYPTNLYSIEHLPNETTVMMEQFADMWQPLSNLDQEEVDNYKQGGYYTAVPLTAYPRLRLLSINTNYFYTSNWYNVLMHTRLTNNEVREMKNYARLKLEDARAAGEKVILVGHHVPGSGDYLISEAKWYSDLVAEFSDIIVLQVAGHTHTDEFRLFYNESSGELKSMLFVSPSMDMHGTKNPSLRMYYLNADTFQLENYEQYYFDLKSVSGTTRPTITQLYSAREAYGLTDMTPASWEHMLERFSTDQDLLLLHRSHSNAKAYTDYSCDDWCRHNYVCHMKYASLDTYTACVNQYAPPPQQSTPPTSSSITILPGIYTLVSILVMTLFL